MRKRGRRDGLTVRHPESWTHRLKPVGVNREAFRSPGPGKPQRDSRGPLEPEKQAGQKDLAVAHSDRYASTRECVRVLAMTILNDRALSRRSDLAAFSRGENQPSAGIPVAASMSSASSGDGTYLRFSAETVC